MNTEPETDQAEPTKAEPSQAVAKKKAKKKATKPPAGNPPEPSPPAPDEHFVWNERHSLVVDSRDGSIIQPHTDLKRKELGINKHDPIITHVDADGNPIEPAPVAAKPEPSESRPPFSEWFGAVQRWAQFNGRPTPESGKQWADAYDDGQSPEEAANALCLQTNRRLEQ